MKFKLISFFVMATVLMSIFAIGTVKAAKPVAVFLAKGALQADVQLAAMVADFPWIEWRVVLTELKPANLTGASFLLMVNIDSSQTYSDSEVTAVKAWYSTGSKTVWVSGDSDFPPNDVKRQSSMNKVLEALGSRLRAEAAAVEDPTSMADAPYRVLGVSDACDAPVKFIVEGVDRALFHGPGPIVSYVNGKYGALETNTIVGLFKVMTSDANGVLKDNDPTAAPQVHSLEVAGRLTLMAFDFDYVKKNLVIATGEAPIAQYQGLYKPELMDANRYGVKYLTQGERLFDNILTFSLTGKNQWCEAQATTAANTAQIATLQGQITKLQGDVTASNSSTSTWQIVAVGLLIIGLIVGAFVGPMVFKKK